MGALCWRRWYNRYLKHLHFNRTVNPNPGRSSRESNMKDEKLECHCYFSLPTCCTLTKFDHLLHNTMSSYSQQKHNQKQPKTSWISQNLYFTAAVFYSWFFYFHSQRIAIKIHDFICWILIFVWRMRRCHCLLFTVCLQERKQKAEVALNPWIPNEIFQ